MQTVFMFPSQLSCYAGMWKKLIDFHPPCIEIIKAAGEVLKRDLLTEFSAQREFWFRRNENVQLAVFLVNSLYEKILKDNHIRTEYSLGFSLGECNHLAHIEAINFANLIKFLDFRGKLYDDLEIIGKRAAVYPVSRSILENCLARRNNREVVEIGGQMSPTAYLLVGKAEAVDECLNEISSISQTSKIRRFKTNIPIHSSLLNDVSLKLEAYLEKEISVNPASKNYLPNITGEFIENPTVRQIRQNLSLLSSRSVQWCQSIESIFDKFEEVRFVEVGAKNLLCRHFQLQPDWKPGINYLFLDDGEENSTLQLEKALTRLS